MKMDKIQNRVEEHAEYVDTQIGEEVRFVTALQGSQNYQMSDEHSDVDTKSIVIPSSVNSIGTSAFANNLFEDIPDDWVCPLCGVGKEHFEKTS